MSTRWHAVPAGRYVTGRSAPRVANSYMTDRTDDGCNVSATCQTCPLAACRYDDRAAYMAWKRERKVGA